MPVRATSVVKHVAANGSVRLDAQARHVRRKLLVTEQGEDILVDLEKAVHLNEGDGLLLEDGRIIAVRAAVEALLEVKARDMGASRAACLAHRQSSP